MISKVRSGSGKFQTSRVKCIFCQCKILLAFQKKLRLRRHHEKICDDETSMLDTVINFEWLFVTPKITYTCAFHSWSVLSLFFLSAFHTLHYLTSHLTEKIKYFYEIASVLTFVWNYSTTVISLSVEIAFIHVMSTFLSCR